jgi:hypothetical protein
LLLFMGKWSSSVFVAFHEWIVLPSVFVALHEWMIPLNMFVDLYAWMVFLNVFFSFFLSLSLSKILWVTMTSECTGTHMA